MTAPTTPAPAAGAPAAPAPSPESKTVSAIAQARERLASGGSILDADIDAAKPPAGSGEATAPAASAAETKPADNAPIHPAGKCPTQEVTR